MKNRTKLPNIYLGVILCLIYLPIVLVVVYSFNESKISSVWGGFSLRWYETLFKDRAMFEALVNSIVLGLSSSLAAAVIGTLGNVFISALSGYGFSRIHFPGRNALFILLLTALMMPIEVIIIPLFYEMKSFNLTDSLIPLMLIPIFCSQGAISAFMFRQFFVTVPKELEEAARLDGLNHFGIFRYVMFPISMPVASSAGILAFLATWNTYLEPLVFTTSITKYTLPLSLNNFNDVYGQPEWHLQLAATTLSVVPVMVVYLIFQEKVTDAMVNSGMKG